MAGRKPKLTQDQVFEALNQAHGMKTGAAEILKVSFKTIERYVAKSEKAQDEIARWHVRRKDRAEYKLDEAIERGESWAIMFALKNAHDREYSDRVDVTTGGKPIVLTDDQIVERITALLLRLEQRKAEQDQHAD
jgi:hypothetical protein